MSKLLYFLVIVGLWAANCQENAIQKVAKSLLECYNDTELLNKNNRAPNNMVSLVAILRKIEDYPGLNMDLRTLSVALLHRFRQDGIIQNPDLPVQEGVTPYAPNGDEFYRHAETLRLIPGHALNFPNNSISNLERCSLHSMLSSSIDKIERGDEPTTCRSATPFRYTRRRGSRSVTESVGNIEDVETLTDEQLETMSNKDQPRDSGVDPNWLYPALPPNHPDNARLYARRPRSQCPVENGVLETAWGSVAGGPLLAGIAAGLQPQTVKLRVLLREEWQSRDALTSTTLDNKWIATIAGDLAEVTLRQGPRAKPMKIGVDGHWNSSTLPKWYFLNSNEDLFLTAAEIRGDIDGLILASHVAEWYAQVPTLKLSQILDMYYSDRGVLNTGVKACNRSSLFYAFAPNSTITEQTYRSALVLSPGLSTAYIEPSAIERFAGQAIEKFFAFLPSMNDSSCSELPSISQKPVNRISTDITIFLDTNWPFASVQPILAALLERLEIGKYNSNFTVLSAYDRRVMIPSSNSILDFYSFNETHYSNFSRGFDLAKTFQTIRTMQSKKLDEEKNRGAGGGNSEIALIIAYTSTISDGDKEYSLEQLSRLREDIPDVRIMFLTYGAKDRWSDLVGNPGTDIFSVGASTTQDNLAPIVGLARSIQRVPQRLVNSQCGSTYSQSGSSHSYDDYLEPRGIQFYRLHPNYFYTHDEDRIPTLKIQGPGSTPLTICTSREVLHESAATASSSCVTTTNIHSVTMPCGDANYIHECNPLYLSILVNSGGNNAFQCLDERYCRYPDMVKITVSYENLVCVNSANSAIFSPIILLLITCIHTLYRS